MWVRVMGLFVSIDFFFLFFSFLLCLSSGWRFFCVSASVGVSVQVFFFSYVSVNFICVSVSVQVFFFLFPFVSIECLRVNLCQCVSWHVNARFFFSYCQLYLSQCKVLFLFSSSSVLLSLHILSSSILILSLKLLPF